MIHLFLFLLALALPSSARSSFCRARSPRGLRVLALFTVGHMYASLCKSGAYAPFSAKRRSRALFWLQLNAA